MDVSVPMLMTTFSERKCGVGLYYTTLYGNLSQRSSPLGMLFSHVEKSQALKKGEVWIYGRDWSADDWWQSNSPRFEEGDLYLLLAMKQSLVWAPKAWRTKNRLRASSFHSLAATSPATRWPCSPAVGRGGSGLRMNSWSPPQGQNRATKSNGEKHVFIEKGAERRSR